MILKPQPGPQERFLASSADIVIYGGAAGGGKSWALLIEPLRHVRNDKFGAVIFRRTMPQITNEGGLWDESSKIYSSFAKPVTSPKPQWTFQSGATISFHHLEHEKNIYDWQGSQIALMCCQVGTKIQMNDGSLVAVEMLSLGDQVKTLSGSGTITAIGHRKTVPCVECRLEDGQAQVQSSDHKILTESGWVSYDDVLARPSTDTVYVPRQARDKEISTQSRYAHRFSLSCDKTRQSLQRCRERFLSRLLRISGCSQWFADRLFLSELCACTASRDQGNGFGWFQCGNLAPEQPPLTLRFQALSSRFLGLLQDIVARVPLCGAVCNARPSSLHADSPTNYLFCRNRRDAQADLAPGSVLSGALRLDGVVVRTQTGSPLDDLGKAQKRIRRKLQYVHPYTGHEQIAEDDASLTSVILTPCGMREVIDITVSNQCHYITESGLANKNCFDELTHFTEAQFWYMLSRNRSMCGVRPYVRATCNPDPDSFVARLIAWWIDQDTGYAIPERSGIIRYFVRVNNEIIWADSQDELKNRYPDAGEPKSFTFIHSSIEDNQALLKADPGYLANLNALPTTERERLKKGNWKVRDERTVIYKPSWWRWWPDDKKMPKILHTFAVWDTAFTAQDQRLTTQQGKAADQSKIAYSACLVLGVWLDEKDTTPAHPEGQHKLLLLSAWWGRVDWDDLSAKVVKIGESKLKNPDDAHLIENAASGRSLLQTLRRNPRNRIIGVTPTPGDGKTDAKVLRAYLSAQYLKRGYVYAPNREWARETVTWLAGFPGGDPPSADLADCLSMGIQHLAQGWWIHHPDDESAPMDRMAEAAKAWDLDNDEDELEDRRAFYG